MPEQLCITALLLTGLFAACGETGEAGQTTSAPDSSAEPSTAPAATPKAIDVKVMNSCSVKPVRLFRRMERRTIRR